MEMEYNGMEMEYNSVGIEYLINNELDDRSMASWVGHLPRIVQWMKSIETFQIIITRYLVTVYNNNYIMLTWWSHDRTFP